MIDVQEQYCNQLSGFFWENAFTQDELVIDRLAYLSELVVEKNETVNLISRKDAQNVVENHIFISAYISKFITDKCSRFIDIGTGGGFPGLPIAIMRPELKGVLVDSIGKKIDAVQEFIDKLMLGNVVSENSRVESPEFIEKYRSSFDLVLTRATVPLILLLRYALPLIKDKAFIVAIKGGDLEEEMEAALLKYKPYIKKSSIIELSYKPTNIRNQKGKKLVILELSK